MRAWFGRFVYKLLIWNVGKLKLQNSRRARVVIEAEGEILLVKALVSRQLWATPGGGVKHDESPAEAAARELQEELGLRLESYQIDTMIEELYKGTKATMTNVYMRIHLDTKPELTPSSEILTHQWFNPDDLPDDLHGSTIQALKHWRQQ